MTRRDGGMELLVSKWGNSLAVRLPARTAKRIGVGEGDTLGVEISTDGRLILAPRGRSIERRDAGVLRTFLARQKVTAPVVGELRRGARY